MSEAKNRVTSEATHVPAVGDIVQVRGVVRQVDRDGTAAVDLDGASCEIWVTSVSLRPERWTAAEVDAIENKAGELHATFGTPETWRVGRSVGRTLYVDDLLIGMVDTEAAAKRIVEAMNAKATEVEVLREQYDRVVARHIEDKREKVNAVYEERDQCVALVAALAKRIGWKVGLAEHPVDPQWDPAWRTIVFIDLPTGQVSWHIHERERPWFAALPDYDGVWDGHTTEQKYARVVGAATGQRPNSATEVFQIPVIPTNPEDEAMVDDLMRRNMPTRGASRPIQSSTSAPYNTHAACVACGALEDLADAEDHECKSRPSDATSRGDRVIVRLSGVAENVGPLGVVVRVDGGETRTFRTDLVHPEPGTDYDQADAVGEARRAALDEERANIVAWLRDRQFGKDSPTWGWCPPTVAKQLADAIWQGAHVPRVDPFADDESTQKRGDGT